MPIAIVIAAILVVGWTVVHAVPAIRAYEQRIVFIFQGNDPDICRIAFIAGASMGQIN